MRVVAVGIDSVMRYEEGEIIRMRGVFLYLEEVNLGIIGRKVILFRSLGVV